MKLTLKDIEGIAHQRYRDRYNTKDCLFALGFAVAIMSLLIIGAVNDPSIGTKNEGSFVVNSVGTLVLEDGEYPMLNGYRLVSADTKNPKNQPLATSMFILAGILTVGFFWYYHQTDKWQYTYKDRMKQVYADTGDVPPLEP
jgi:hypothetical protein